MEGIDFIDVGKAHLVIVRGVSDEFQDHLRERLAAYCYGASAAGEDTEFYSFDRTMEEFLVRFNSKSRATKIGMAGELLTHILMPVIHPNLSVASVYFNKEERSIKKGFDLTFFESASSSVWYGEVKSGEVINPAMADDKAADLIGLAESSLAEMLDDAAHLSRWDAALIDTHLTLESNEAATVRKLFQTDSSTIRKGNSIKKQAILSSAVMHELAHCEVSPAVAAAIAQKVESNATFTDFRVLIIQQDALEAVIESLSVVANG